MISEQKSQGIINGLWFHTAPLLCNRTQQRTSPWSWRQVVHVGCMPKCFQWARDHLGSRHGGRLMIRFPCGIGSPWPTVPQYLRLISIQNTNMELASWSGWMNVTPQHFWVPPWCLVMFLRISSRKCRVLIVESQVLNRLIAQGSNMFKRKRR